MEELDLLEAVQKCQSCKGVGKKLSGKKLINCECTNAALFKYRLLKSNLPPRLQKFEFREYIYKNSPTFQKVSKYLQNTSKVLEKGIGIYLHGSENDCNMLAIGALKELMKLGYSCYYTPFSSCLSAGTEVDISEDRFTFVCIANITTVLDNLTNFKQTVLTGTTTNGAVTYLEQVLSTRASLNLPTLITSAVGPEVLIEKFPSLGTLIYGNLVAVQCVDNDFRNKGAYEKLQHEVGFDQL